MKLPVFTCVAILALSAGAAYAPAVLATEASNATGYCQGVLPAADSQIRKRPLALRNEGTATAFVSCSIPVNFAGPNLLIDAHVINRSANPATVSCTLVDGVVAEVGQTDPSYYPRSVDLGPGGGGLLEWWAPAFDLDTFTDTANLSCALPPGVEIALIAASE
jgi:hypothetical protein